MMKQVGSAGMKVGTGGQLVLPDLCFSSSRIQLKRNALLVQDPAPVARM